jgi:bifunctional non-homologous end joining protein LigD
MTMSSTAFKVGRVKLNLSNLEKVLYPAAGFTKGDVVHYYLKIAPLVLPHLKDRALTLKRYPNGVDKLFFYEKRCPVHRPEWVSTAEIQSGRSGSRINYCVIDDAASLVWVANLASLELHTLLSRVKDPSRPTMMVFDLDPGEPAGVIDAARIGLRLRDVLSGLGLECFAKTSGGKGIHLAVPLNTPVTFDDTKSFSRALAMMLEREDSEHVTSVMRKSLRMGKVFVDWSQNDEHKTTACVYSLRARQRPTVSTPVTWRELETAVKRNDPSLLSFETDDVLKRVATKKDFFAPVLKLRQRLPSFDSLARSA